MYQRMMTVLLTLIFSGSVFATEYIVKQKPNAMMTLSSITGLSVLDRHAKGNLVKVDINDKKEKEILHM